MNQVSSRVVIGNVLRNFHIDTSTMRADIIEWTGEAIEFIGLAPEMESRTVTIKIKDYRALLPIGLMFIASVKYNDVPLSYRGTSYSYFESVYSASSTEPSETLVYNNQTFTRYASPLIRTTSEEWWEVTGRYIKSSIEDGEIELTYKALSTDQEGFLMIPDEINYKKAVERYVMTQLFMRGYTHPVIDYDTAEYQWSYYRREAYNKGLFTEFSNSWERFRNSWVRLIDLQTM